MAGTIEGGKRAAATNLVKYGPDFYARIGSMGGKNGHTGGFGAFLRCDGCELDDLLGLEHTKARCAGYRGGKKSRRGKPY